MAEPDRGSTSGAPRLVKVAGIIAVVLLLLLGIIMLIGGEHGPGRHAPSGVGGGHTPPAGREHTL
jgi:hypothetical protein